MTPFLQFRLWARRAPGAERLLTAGVAVALLGLLCWALVPVGGSSAGGTGVSSFAPGTGSGGVAKGAAGAVSSTGGTAQAVGGAGGTVPGGGSSALGSVVSGGAASAGGGSGGVAGGGSGGVVGSGSGGGGASTGQGAGPGSGGGPVTGPPGGGAASCGALTATDQGVTPTEIKIDIDVADLAGQAGNSLVGLPSAQVEEAMFQAAIDAANKAGGIRCRKLVAKYYEVDALDTPSLQAACLSIVADRPFALLDQGLGAPSGSTAPRDCAPSYHLPEFGALAVSQAELTQYSPYLISEGATIEGITNDYVHAAKQLHWFATAKKVGLLEQDCIPGLNGLVLSDLTAVGIPRSEVSTFDFGCPDEIPPPNEVEQAVLQFKTAGVTNVMDDGGYENYFSKDAQIQDYHPSYSVGDAEGEIALWDNPNFGPDATNFSGALAVTASQYGAENTPGTVFDAETAACDRAMAAEGLPSAEKSADGESGTSCALVDLLVAAADNAPALVRADLAAGLQRAGRLEFAFPVGPGNFASYGVHGGGYWRADTWVTSCGCFRLSDPVYSPSFASP